MRELKAGRRYAKALMELAGQTEDWDKIDQDFQKVRGLIERHPEITHLVLNPTLSHAEKEDFIDKIFGGEINRLLMNFIKVLISKRRFSETDLIQEEFHRLYEKKRGLQQVTVVSPVPLREAHEEKLRGVLQQKLRAEIRLKTEVNPGMLGGLILRFDGKEIDTSYRSGLNEIRQRLMT